MGTAEVGGWGTWEDSVGLLLWGSVRLCPAGAGNPGSAVTSSALQYDFKFFLPLAAP